MKKAIKKAIENGLLLLNKKAVFLSDTHLGAGDNADESVNVQHLIFHALKYYYKNGYTVVLLGDSFELAETHDIEKIKNVHDDVMWILSELHNNGQLVVVKGNHDYKLNEKLLGTRESQYDGSRIDFLKDVKVYDSVNIVLPYQTKSIVAMHGNQYFWRYSSWFNKLLVWLGPLWKKYQLHFKDYHIAEYTGWQDADKCQKYFNELGKEKDIHFVIGHTHKTNFKMSNLTDCGSFGCMPRCVTCVEFEPYTYDTIKIKNDIRLNTCKFAEEVEDNGNVVVKRSILGTQNP